MCKTDVHFFEDEVDRGFGNFAQSSAIFLYTSSRGGDAPCSCSGWSGMAAAILNNSLLISLHHEIIVFGMAFEPGLYERAIDFYRQMVGAGMVECVLCQGRSDTVAGDFVRDFGMHEYDLAF